MTLEEEVPVGLEKANAIRVVLTDFGTQHGGKWKRRENLFFYNCLDCGKEIAFRGADLKRMSGRCRMCADKHSGPITGLKLRLEPFSALYRRFCYDRKRTHTDYDLSYEDFLGFTKESECHYCGAAIIWPMHNLSKNGYRSNLDRKDNSLGYLKSNVVVCCWPCNETKSDRFTYEQFLEIGNLIRKWEGR